MKDKYIGLPVYKAFKDFLTLLRNNKDTNYIKLFRFYILRSLRIWDRFKQGSSCNSEVEVLSKNTVMELHTMKSSFSCRDLGSCLAG